ncbi:hypothetical protein [Pyxidicoccus xibeiensis]|uniref:hypothetical protein n=1 Tax=Pyxidicoccus xibeiensis TaxID=2906759 RepID=UPI0020A81FD8|nr:hypothetical protein [Pyxidicoccus xibeiensis]MCP3136769.1 hypothetical protein [Pyxidicoccus xibeiensis]
MALPGDVVSVRLTVSSAGAQVKSGGVFVDLRAVETVRLPSGTQSGVSLQTSKSSYTSFEQQFAIAPTFTLAPNETKVFEGQVRLPSNVEPSFMGHYAQHEWAIRGRLEMTGNDPDSGFSAIRVGAKG